MGLTKPRSKTPRPNVMPAPQAYPNYLANKLEEQINKEPTFKAIQCKGCADTHNQLKCPSCGRLRV